MIYIYYIYSRSLYFRVFKNSCWVDELENTGVFHPLQMIIKTYLGQTADEHIHRGIRLMTAVYGST